MAENNKPDYDALIKEVDGLNPATADAEGQWVTAERMVELQKQLSEIALADRNDDHKLIWDGLHEKANAMIAELAGKSFDGISADQLQAFESLLENFSSHTSDGYSGIAADLKSKLDTLKEGMEKAESVNDEQIQGNEAEDKPDQANNIEKEDENDNMTGAEGTELEAEEVSFLESINEENKEQIIARYNRLEQTAEELGNLLDNNEYTVAADGFDFKGLNTFYDNVWIDSEPQEEPDTEQKNKRDWLKDTTQTLATNLALKDLVQDGSIDEITDKEELKKRLAEAVHDNMTFLTYSLVSTQAGFETLAESQNIEKMLPKDRQAFLAAVHDKSNAAMQTVAGILSGTDKSAVKLSSAAIVSTYAPHQKEAETFSKEFKEKTGLNKLWNRVKSFDDKMTQKYPLLWGFAKSSAISYAAGPAGIAAMVGYSTYKQFKMLKKEYNKQKAENGGEMKLWDFIKKNPGKIAAASVGVASTCLAAGTGLEAAFGGQFGAIGNVTGALLSGDAPNAVGQITSISFDRIADAGKNLVQSISDTQSIDLHSVAEGIKNSWTPTRIFRSAMNLGAGVVKATEAYMKADDGNKWSAAKKQFIGTVTGLIAGSALADVTAAATHEFQENQAFEHMKNEIEAGEKAFQQELQNADFSDIKIPMPPDYTADAGELPEVTITGHAHHHTVENTPAPEPRQEPVQNQETEVEKEAEKTVELKVNGETVETKLGNTLEETLDNAREQYLQENPEIDPDHNTVEIEGEGGKATIETNKEDIMKGEAVIGQETEIHREITTEDAQIKDDIQEIKTDTGQAKLMESDGRFDTDEKNNIPDGAKVLNVTEFHNENQDLKFTEYEQNGERYITDGEQTRLAPTNGPQSAEHRMETWKEHLKETAAAGYDENGTPIVSEQPQAETQTQATQQEAKTNVENDAAPKNEQQADEEKPAQENHNADTGVSHATTQSGVSYSISENGSLWTGEINIGGMDTDGTLSLRYVNHLMPEKYHNVISTESTQLKSELTGMIIHHEIYNDLLSQSETRELTNMEQEFMKFHETQLEEKGLISREDGVMEYKDTPKDQYYQLKPENDNSAANEDKVTENVVEVHDAIEVPSMNEDYGTPDGNPPTYNEQDDKYAQFTDNTNKSYDEFKDETKDGYQEFTDKVDETAKDFSNETNDKYAQFTDNTNKGYDEFKDETKDGYQEFTDKVDETAKDFSNETNDKYAQFVNSTNKGYDEFKDETKDGYDKAVEETNSSYNDYVGEVNDNYKEHIIKINNDWDEDAKKGAEEWNKHVEEAIKYQNKDFINYDKQTEELGLKNAQTIDKHETFDHKYYQDNRYGTLIYDIPEQTEFRQGTNGFAIMHNDEIRSVTADSKGNLQFQITQNGKTDLMTKEEAQQFFKDVASQGAKTENFDNKLFNDIAATKHIGDSHGSIKYGDGNGRDMESNNHIHTNTKSSIGHLRMNLRGGKINN